MDWIRRSYKQGSTLYSACSRAIMLAATGLLDNCEATSHWAYQDLFRTRYPKVRFRPEPNLVFADAAGRIVTAGGTTSWHDLALHIISRHCSPGSAGAGAWLLISPCSCLLDSLIARLLRQARNGAISEVRSRAEALKPDERETHLFLHVGLHVA